MDAVNAAIGLQHGPRPSPRHGPWWLCTWPFPWQQQPWEHRRAGCCIGGHAWWAPRACAACAKNLHSCTGSHPCPRARQRCIRVLNLHAPTGPRLGPVSGKQGRVDWAQPARAPPSRRHRSRLMNCSCQQVAPGLLRAASPGAGSPPAEARFPHHRWTAASMIPRRPCVRVFPAIGHRPL